MTAETVIAIAHMGILCAALWTIWTSSRGKPFDELKKLIGEYKKSIDELTKCVSHLEAHVSEIKGFIRGREEKN